MADATNYARKYNFVISTDMAGDINHTSPNGDLYLGFSSVSGIEMGINVARYREGHDEDLHGTVIPGRNQLVPLVCSRGIAIGKGAGFYDILKKAESAGDDNDDILSIGASNDDLLYLTIYGRSNSNTARRFKIKKPRIVHIKVDDLESASSADDTILLETLTIVHSGLEPL